MKVSVASLALALFGSAMGYPFKPNGTSVYRTSSAILTSSQTPGTTSSTFPSHASLPNHSGSSGASVPGSASTSVFGSEPISLNPGPAKRGDSLAIPTDLPSLVSDAQLVAAAFSSVGIQKRGGSLSLPTDLPSLVSDVESAFSSLASSGAQRRDGSLSIPTDLPSFASDAESLAAALASSGAQKREFSSKSHTTPTKSPTGTSTPSAGSILSPSFTTPTGFPSTVLSQQPLPSATGLPFPGVPFA